MQEVDQSNLSHIEAGERRYKEWSDTLLSTPEAQESYAEIAEEHDLWLQLTEARLNAGLTQAELAKKIGISRAQVKRIEQCGYSECTLDVLHRYAKALGKKVSVSLA